MVYLPSGWGELGYVEKRLFNVGKIVLFFFQRFVVVFDQQFSREQFLAKGVEHFLCDSPGILLLASLLLILLVAVWYSRAA